MASRCHRESSLRPEQMAADRTDTLERYRHHCRRDRIRARRLAAVSAVSGHVLLDCCHGPVEMGDGNSLGYRCRRAHCDFGRAGAWNCRVAQKMDRANAQSPPEHRAVATAFRLHDPGGRIHRSWPQGRRDRHDNFRGSADDPDDIARHAEDTRGNRGERKNVRRRSLAVASACQGAFRPNGDIARHQPGHHAVLGDGRACKLHRDARTRAKAAAASASAEGRTID